MSDRRELITGNQVSQLGKLVNNLSLIARSRSLQNLLDPGLRDLDKEFQYPRIGDATLFHRLYDEEGVATRVVNVYPDECWSVYPELYERESARRTTFERAWDDILDRLDVWHYLHRVDRMSGIGRFGVLMLGLDDGLPLDSPVPGVNPDGSRAPGAPAHKLLYLRTFDETLVRVNKLELETSNPRYGQPVEYVISFFSASGQQGIVNIEPNMLVSERPVHWTRVVHIADNRMASETFGVPRLQPVYRRIYDLRKVLGGSAEMFWRGAFPGYAVETLPDLASEGVEFDEQSIKDQFERYMNGLQRYLAFVGQKVTPLTPQISDPSAHVQQLMQYIATSIEVPYRVFTGSEAGQLASTQDAATWNKRVARRQRNYLNPMVVRPFVERLVSLGVLPPVSGFSTIWSDLNSLTDEQQAAVAMKKTQSLLQYVTSGAETVMPVLYFFVDVLGLSEERAQMVIEAAKSPDKKLTEELWKAPPESAMANTTPDKATGGSRNAQKSGTPRAKRQRAVTGRNV